MDWMLMPIRRYAEFSGRSQRKEYWMFVLFQTLVLSALVLVGFAIGAFDNSGDGTFAGIFMVVIFLVYLGAFFVPSLAVQVRRMHDQDKSGWFILLGFIPYIGGIIMLVFMCLEGTKGPNQYGEDPKNPTNADVFS